MFSSLSKVAIGVVLAGAATHATGVALGFQGLGVLPGAGEFRVNDDEPARSGQGGFGHDRLPEQAIAALPAATPSAAEWVAAGRGATAAEPAPMKVPPAPQTSAGTRRVLAALDAFEDEIRFYAGIGGTELTQGRDSRGEHDAAGNILGTLLPGGGGGASDAAGLGLGYRESTVEDAAAGTGTALRARVAESGEIVGPVAWSSLDYEPVPLGRSGVAEPSAVPVPAGFPLLLAGIAALAGLRRRR